MTSHVISARLVGSKMKYQNQELRYKTKHYKEVNKNGNL